ncbi:hypothetical protein EfsSVR2332_16200 [Enterococcus faecalis]|uniref:Uncharacterized protein n=1 Tax=Enterococcus faecalis TaxID=1351 RepID=A0AC59HPG6_ENTFL|nr:hypothetical protein EfsSVR2332_16200 [Enterococcus faecalis]
MANNILKAKNKPFDIKILSLTGDDDTWMNNPEIVREVQRLSTLLNSDRIGDKRPLPRLDPDKLTKEEYQRLLDLGYQVKDIKKALGLGTTTFQNWRMANEIENKIKRKQNNKAEENKHMKFNINTASLLLPGTFEQKEKSVLRFQKVD